MGGGDLNTKKSWHPSTLKNQERVWAAERAAEQERARIAELQRERGGERERDELRALGRSGGTLPPPTDTDKLSWMYNQPNKTGDTEDYLLGKVIDNNYERLAAEDKTGAPPKNHVEHEVIPFSIRQLRAGGPGVPETQVDLQRKLQEDPLAAIRARELEARTQLLHNPLRLRRLTQLLQHQQEKRKEKKAKKKSKKNKSDIDQLLAEKLSGLHGKKIDLNSLLSANKKKKKKKSRSRSDSSESSDDEKQDKKKKKKKRKASVDRSTKKLNYSSHSDEKNKHTASVHHKTDLIDKLIELKSEINRRNSQSKKSPSCDPERDEKSRGKKKHRKHTPSEERTSKRSSNDVATTSRIEEKSSKKKRKSSQTDDESPKRHKHKDKKASSSKKSKQKDRSRSREAASQMVPELKQINSKARRRHSSSGSEIDSSPAQFGLISADGRKLTTSKHQSEDKKKALPKKEETWKRPAVQKLSEEEKERRRREMMSAAAVREVEREKNLSRHREETKREEAALKSSRFDSEFATRQTARAADASVQHRIRSNVYNIQRSSRHMDVNFAKR